MDFKKYLTDDILKFWLSGIDKEDGGIITHLKRDGSFYSDEKSVWFQGRALWTFAKAYNFIEKKAEYLERAIYVCPYCGLSEFESHGNEMECKKCHRKVLYGADKSLKGLGYEHPFPFVNEWYDYQQDFINNLDVTKYAETPLYEENTTLSEVILYKKKVELRKEAKIQLYGDKIIIDAGTEDELKFPFSEVSAISVL